MKQVPITNVVLYYKGARLVQPTVIDNDVAYPSIGYRRLMKKRRDDVATPPELSYKSEGYKKWAEKFIFPPTFESWTSHGISIIGGRHYLSVLEDIHVRKGGSYPDAKKSVEIDPGITKQENGYVQRWEIWDTYTSADGKPLFLALPVTGDEDRRLGYMKWSSFAQADPAKQSFQAIAIRGVTFSFCTIDSTYSAHAVATRGNIVVAQEDRSVDDIVAEILHDQGKSG